MLMSVSGWSGPSFAFWSFSVSSQSGRARSSFPAARYAWARLFMLVSVSGWSGPSFAFESFSASSKSGRARSSFPAA